MMLLNITLGRLISFGESDWSQSLKEESTETITSRRRVSVPTVMMNMIVEMELSPYEVE